MQRKFTYFIFFLFIALNILAQDGHKIDSLKNITSKGNTHQQITAYNSLFDVYLNNIPDTAYFYLQKAIKLSNEHTSINDKIECNFRLNNWLDNKGDFFNANNYLYIVIELAHQINDSQSIAKAANKIAHNFYRYGSYDSALKYSIKAIHINQQLKNKQGEYSGLNTSGNIYTSLGNYTKALDCFKQNYEVAVQLNDDRSICTALNNIGLAYQGLKNNKDALDYFLKALPYSKIIGKDWEAASCLNIGLAYEGLEQYTKAAPYYQKTIEISTQIDFNMGVVFANNYLGSLFIKTKQYNKAIEHLEKALLIVRKMGAKPQLNETYKFLSDAYRGLNDYKKADEYFQLHTQIKDSLLNESTSKQVAEMQTKYETENKEKTILLLHKDKKLTDVEIGKQRVVRNYLIGVGLLILLLALVLIKANKNKQKANEILIKQKEEILIQRDLIEAQKQILEHQKKEITDSINYAQRIQHAIHAPIEEVKKNLPDSFILYKPKDIVSGDFYWFDKKNETCYIAAADCTGHGIPGAMMTMIGTILMNEILSDSKMIQPSSILKKLNYLLDITYRQAKIADGMDISLCAFSTKTNELQYAAANRPLYLIRKNGAEKVEEIKANKTAIGSITQIDYEFTNHTIQLERGDIFYLFSDGYADQFGGDKQKKLTTKKFKEILLLIKDKPMQEQEEYLDKYILNWRNTLEQVDDLLVIGVRV
jgi:serine phosphatase RsbU (regulator of sigma subunit)